MCPIRVRLESSALLRLGVLRPDWGCSSGKENNGLFLAFSRRLLLSQQKNPESLSPFLKWKSHDGVDCDGDDSGTSTSDPFQKNVATDRIASVSQAQSLHGGA